MWQWVNSLKVFNTLTLKQISWKKKTFFKKLEYRFLVESTKIKNASFPYKTAISEANVKKNKMLTKNGPITKNGVLPVTTLFFWKFCFSLRTTYTEFVFCTNNPNALFCTFFKRWSFIWRCFFPVSILNSNKHVARHFVRTSVCLKYQNLRKNQEFPFKSIFYKLWNLLYSAKCCSIMRAKWFA